LNTKEQFEIGEISERKRGTLLKGLSENIERPLRKRFSLKRGL
jgi:hypothetical protein